MRSTRPTRCSATRMVVERSKLTIFEAPCRFTPSFMASEHSAMALPDASGANRFHDNIAIGIDIACGDVHGRSCFTKQRLEHVKRNRVAVETEDRVCPTIG